MKEEGAFFHPSSLIPHPFLSGARHFRIAKGVPAGYTFNIS
jgi:hypothetical protein